MSTYPYQQIADIHDKRSNKRTELVVNRGLVAARFGGTPAGIKIMRENGVSMETCLRVLMTRYKHRASDWK